MSKDMKELPGTPVSGKELKSGNLITFKWRPNAKYAWSAGIAYGRFLDELKEGRIIGRRCSRCERIIVPPRMFCEHCFVATDEWVLCKDTGTINTFSLSYLDADANRIKEPIPVAVIDIDGASPGVGLLHILGNVDPKKIDVGMKVKAVWKPPKERLGSVTDILYWEPMED